MSIAECKIQLEKRTVAFSVVVLKLLRQIPVGMETRNIRDQLARSATAVGANYREANRAESRNDFVHKIAVTAKEASESEYWLLLLAELHPDVADIGVARTEQLQYPSHPDAIPPAAKANIRFPTPPWRSRRSCG